MTKFHNSINDFLAMCEVQRSLSTNSVRGYKQDLAAFYDFWIARSSPDKLTPSLILDYLQYLREVKEYQPATVRRRIVTLRKFCGWRTEGGEAQSPFSGLTLDLKLPKRLPRPVDRPTISRILRAHSISSDLESEAQTTQWSNRHVTHLVIRILVSTGLRIGEATHLRLRDVSTGATCLRVKGKGDRERSVYISNCHLIQDFQRYLHFRTSVHTNCPYVFLNAQENRLTEAAFRKRLKTMAKRLDINENITPHRFRHSAATLLIEEGVDMRMVQRLLGHASIATTEIYTQVSDVSLIAAMERADVLSKVS